MAEMLNDLEALYKHIEASPEDWETYLVLADWYEEHGVDHVAECLRWQADKQRRAWYYKKEYNWIELIDLVGENYKSHLPKAIHSMLMGHTNTLPLHVKKYPTRRQAQSALYGAYMAARAFGWNGELA